MTRERSRRTLRSRPIVCGCVVAVIMLGLLSRRFPLPGVLAKETGDALYATMVFFGLALIWPRGRPRRLAAAAFVACAAIECSQLLTWPWLVSVRAHWLGALVLGQGFQVADLWAYAAGVGLAVGVDRLLPRHPEP